MQVGREVFTGAAKGISIVVGEVEEDRDNYIRVEMAHMRHNS